MRCMIRNLSVNNSICFQKSSLINNGFAKVSHKKLTEMNYKYSYNGKYICKLILNSNLQLVSLKWTTLIIGYFYIDYQLVRYQLRTKLRTMYIRLFI